MNSRRIFEQATGLILLILILTACPKPEDAAHPIVGQWELQQYIIWMRGVNIDLEPYDTTIVEEAGEDLYFHLHLRETGSFSSTGSSVRFGGDEGEGTGTWLLQDSMLVMSYLDTGAVHTEEYGFILEVDTLRLIQGSSVLGPGSGTEIRHTHLMHRN